MASSDPCTHGERSSGGGADRIRVDGLVVDAFVGTHDVERTARQRVRFDVEVATVDDYVDRVRSTGAFVSYADIVDYIQRRADSGEHVDLVETWAEDVARFALRHELATAARVTVRKLDVFDAADGVGITIERRRDRHDDPPASGRP